MKGKFKIAVLILLAVITAAVLAFFVRNASIGSLNPKGVIALQERDAIVFTVGMMLVIVIPTLIILFMVAWKYRADNQKVDHIPDAKYSFFGEFVLWLFPLVIVLILIIPTWNAAHQVDPFKALTSNVKPLTIQVVALNWKWLFIYPEQNIATVNFIEFPASTPLNFELTADAPMNSFWIPQLGGQMYAMAGMSTQLHLIADAPGEFAGTAVEINGAGFAGMKFIAKAISQADFDAWVASVKKSSPALTLDVYHALAEDSQNNPPAFYGSVWGSVGGSTEHDLYTTIIMKYMVPIPSSSNTNQNASQRISQPSQSYGGQAGMQNMSM